MKAIWARLAVCLAIVIASPVWAQKQTIARLSHELDVEASRSAAASHPAEIAFQHHTPAVPLVETPLSRAAARALFVHSDLTRARLIATEALRQNRLDAEALFVKMEAAAMQADQAAMIEAAVRLCEVAGGPQSDERIGLATVRLREAAANSREFRKVIPRIQAVLANSDGNWPELNAALLAAAMDGAPGLDAYAVSRAAGILTDWRIVGPFGRQSLTDFDKAFVTGRETLSQASYGGRTVENFQFPDGTMALPDYLSRHGVFYASSSFASMTAGPWRLQANTAGMLEVSVDGTVVLHHAQLVQRDDKFPTTLELAPGPHRVLAKFAGSAAPIRIQVTPEITGRSKTTRPHVSAQELAYELAAREYAEGDYPAGVEQLEAVPPSMTTAPIAFLLAQNHARLPADTTVWDSEAAWKKLLAMAPGALAADVALARSAVAERNSAQAAIFAWRVLTVHRSNDAALEMLTEIAAAEDRKTDDPSAALSAIWSERLAVHPSCDALQKAVSFYRQQHEMDAALAAQKSLEGCAPESLAYAQSLAEQGRHAESAETLKTLLAGAPLNRAARLMLVRELQRAGQDTEAQKAASQWLQVAPNAVSYRRLATLEENSSSTAGGENNTREPFYESYRRDVLPLLHENIARPSHDDAVLLLNDHVAIARPDGSVSLYIHRATRILSPAGASRYADGALPEDGQVLQLRTVTAEGKVNVAAVDPLRRQIAYGTLAPGDTIEEEYVVNYIGDGGIAQHSEAFQFVFGSFDMPVENARFVVLTTAEQADQGVVIATGDAPKMAAKLDNGMLARIWEKDAELQSASAASAIHSGLAIVRVVEQENGWMVPRNAERQRKIETIHPGPRLEES